MTCPPGKPASVEQRLHEEGGLSLSGVPDFSVFCVKSFHPGDRGRERL